MAEQLKLVTHRHEESKASETNMQRMARSLLLLIVFVAGCIGARLALSRAGSATLELPPGTSAILDNIYSARTEAAVAQAKQFEQQDPENPLGYLLEAEARWWKIWCAAAEFKYGMTMARHREKLEADQPYLDLTTKAYKLAENSIHKHDSGPMRLYAGMADGLAARLYGLRGETRAGARAGVHARENFLKALSLDPTLTDAYLGLGLYNYYVDTLSGLARVLRFFMGIPGGSKEEGIRQLQKAINGGELSPALARFYLALDLHSYDQKYNEALEVIRPLAEKYPDNPVFQLMRGDLDAKLNRKTQAEASYSAAASGAEKLTDADCRKKINTLVDESLAALNR
jgi:tetratricopeptide (TPR) repeat protein